MSNSLSKQVQSSDIAERARPAHGRHATTSPTDTCLVFMTCISAKHRASVARLMHRNSLRACSVSLNSPCRAGHSMSSTDCGCRRCAQQ